MDSWDIQGSPSLCFHTCEHRVRANIIHPHAHICAQGFYLRLSPKSFHTCMEEGLSHVQVASGTRGERFISL